MDSLFTIFAVTLFVTGVVYVREITRFIKGLSKLAPGINTQQYSVVVLVPARNEERHIQACVNSLLQQDYPKDKYRIIVIDDQSTDGTAEVVRRLAQEHSKQLALLSATERPAGVSPKINALQYGIRESADDLVFTTDADCQVSSRWISSSMKYFETNVGVVTGTTLYQNSNATPPQLFGIQFLDFLSHTACAAGAIGNGKVNNCNGSNMAFRRSAYDEIGGYGSLAHLNCGDDSLLAQKIAATSRWKVRFSLDKSSFVTTAPASSWSELFHQRMRWASQTADYHPDTLVFLISSFLYYLALTAVFLGSLFHFQWIAFFVIAYVPKLLVDYIILKKFTSFSGTEHLMKFYPEAAVVHIPIILFAVFGGFFGRFKWKDRVTKRRSTL